MHIKISTPGVHVFLNVQISSFYGNKNSASAKSYFLNNLSKLDGFIAEFKKNQQKLIKLAEENRVVRPWIKGNHSRVELTPKEKLIGQLYSRGRAAKNIAAEVGVKEKTIFNYLESLKDKYFLVDEERTKATLIKKLRMDFELFHG